MARWCRVLASFVLAITIARASVTVSWNTRRPSGSGIAQAQIPVQNARVLAVQGARVLLRLQDGSIQNYTATPLQVRQLRQLVGATIQFRIR